MDITKVQDIVEESYEIKIKNIEKVKNVYRIETTSEVYCLKVINYEFEHFLFIFSAIKHLQNNGFKTIPKIIETKDEKEYWQLEDKYVYLTPWINARECNYNNPVDLTNATIKLAELHKCSLNFNINENMRPRIGWNRWIEIFKTREKEILDFKRRIELKHKKSEFDYLYLSNMDVEIKRCEKSIFNLLNSNYYDKMKIEVLKKGFCHHDYAHHNILIDTNGEINIIDFDYCMLDTHLHDLSSLLIRRMKYGKWDVENAKFILNTYKEVSAIEQDDIPIMAAFMEFPQDYWQRGIQYYWEKKTWGEEFFLKKLKDIYNDKDEKQEFIDKFRTIKN